LFFEDVMNVIEQEKPIGVIVQFGGQTAINLAAPLVKAGIRILGSSLESIDAAEDRKKFEALLRKLDIAQPEGSTVTSVDEAVVTAQRKTVRSSKRCFASWISLSLKAAR
ncbi:hypothetical protein AB4Z21_38690, partial [Paenibacillus sp. MCAF20]